jgi:predicted metalloprotease with PDZ domain
MDLQKLALEMASFFRDSSPLIRVFIRHAHNLCATGEAFYRTFVFFWTSLALEESSDADYLEFLAHEMVHNWPRLDVPPEHSWYNEGIATYYSIVLPYRFGIYTRETFIERMNLLMSSYYTNPDLHMPNAEAAQKFWSDAHANRILYQRGFAYFVSLAAQLSHRPSEKPSLDDLVISMLKRYSSGAPTDISDFLSLLSSALGPGAISEHDGMVNGAIIVPTSDSLGQDYTLEAIDQEQFYLGFNEHSFSGPHPVVRDLDPKSRASIEGGVLEGDVITSNHSFLYSAESWDRNFTMAMTRSFGKGGDSIDTERNVTLTWWPRSWEKVSSRQWVLTSEDSSACVYNTSAQK